MKSFSRLALVVFISGCTAFASASDADYRTNVLDPLPPIGETSYPTFIITSTTFQISFSACAPNELPGGIQADGCFAGVNKSGFTWDNLQFTFPNTDVLHSQPVSCEPAASDNIFGNTDCELDPNGLYVLNFTNGLLMSGDFFFVTEDGVVPASSFPTGTATVLTSTTPEPAPLLLLATGLIAMGIVVRSGLHNKALVDPRL